MCLRDFFLLFYPLFLTRLSSQSAQTRNVTKLFSKNVKIWWKQKASPRDFSLVGINCDISSSHSGLSKRTVNLHHLCQPPPFRLQVYAPRPLPLSQSFQDRPVAVRLGSFISLLNNKKYTILLNMFRNYVYMIIELKTLK